MSDSSANSTKKADPNPSSKLPDFEKQLAALEEIVAEMEKGEMTLEESLQAYERGIKLTRECQAALDSAQQRIDVLTEKSGTLIEEPFDSES